MDDFDGRSSGRKGVPNRNRDSNVLRHQEEIRENTSPIRFLFHPSQGDDIENGTIPVLETFLNADYDAISCSQDFDPSFDTTYQQQ